MAIDTQGGNMATSAYTREAVMDVAIHAVESYRFDLLRDAFPSGYRRVGDTEWLTIKFPAFAVTFFRA